MLPSSVLLLLLLHHSCNTLGLNICLSLVYLKKRYKWIHTFDRLCDLDAWIQDLVCVWYTRCSAKSLFWHLCPFHKSTDCFFSIPYKVGASNKKGKTSNGNALNRLGLESTHETWHDGFLEWFDPVKINWFVCIQVFDCKQYQRASQKKHGPVFIGLEDPNISKNKNTRTWYDQ